MRRPERRPGDRLTEDQRRELDALDRTLAGETAASEAEGRLAGLVVAVRDDRPPPDAAFVADLDERVAAGFPRRAGGGPREVARRWDPGRLGTRHWLGGLGAAATLAAVVAVVAGAGPASGPAPRVVGEQTLAAPAVSSGAAPHSSPAIRSPRPGAPTRSPQSATASTPSPGASSAAGASAGSSVTVAPPVPAPGAPVLPSTTTGGTRAVQRDAALALLAPRGQVQKVSDRVIAATDQLGGIVGSSNVAVDDQGGSQATLELEVPSAALDRALATLSALAHVSSRTQNTLDITDPTAAAVARLAESRAERHALLRQLAQATTDNQVASIRAQLGLVGGRIAQDEAGLQSLRRRAQLAQLSVTVTEDQQSAGGGAGGSGWGPGAALDDALSVLEAVFAVLVIALAGFVPVVIVGALGWAAVRPLRRRWREAAIAGPG